MDFATKVKKYRAQHEWTQQVVAEKLGVSRKTISSWENGRSYPDIFMLVQLSDLYHVSLDDLLREDHEMIDNYKKEHVANAKQDQTFIVAYLINGATTLYFLYRALFGVHFLSQLPLGWQVFAGILLVIATANIYFLLSRISWRDVNRANKVGSILTFVIVAALLVRLNINAVVDPYSFGQALGLGLADGLAGLSIVETVWLYRQFRERRNH